MTLWRPVSSRGARLGLCGGLRTRHGYPLASRRIRRRPQTLRAIRKEALKCPNGFSASWRVKGIQSHRLTDLDATSVSQSTEELNPTVEAASDGTYLPSSYRLPSGQLSFIDTSAPIRPEDAFEDPPDGSRSWRTDENGYLVKTLSTHVYNVAIESPLEPAAKLSAALGNKILLKREDLQPVFSFKLRGAYNLMSHLTKEQLKGGVICSSAGNHAQGVALAASKLKCDAVICMPTSTPSIKVDAVKRLGSTVKLIGDSYQEAEEYAKARAVEEGRSLVPPFDDPYTIAGQGTIGKEILDAVKPGNGLDIIFVSVGGGGLIAGIAAYVKAIRPNVKVIGVEPVGANAMAISLHQGYRIRLSQVDAFSDGVAVKTVGKETFRLCRRHVDGIVMVDNSACSAAIKDVYDETRSILEPAGALALAGAKAYLNHYNLENQTVVAVCSGANINFNSLRLVSELADVGARREFMLASSISEKAGSFREFVETALEGTDLYVTEFRYRYSAGLEAHIMWGVGAHGQKEVDDLVERLVREGFPTMDISQVDEMQSLFGSFVGGRPRSYMGSVPNEKIFKVLFPERRGALQAFLKVVSPRWNVTMFCYRNIGTEATSVMIGIQLPPQEEKEFADAIALLNGFTIQSISEMGQKLYRMFLQ